MKLDTCSLEVVAYGEKRPRRSGYHRTEFSRLLKQCVQVDGEELTAANRMIMIFMSEKHRMYT